MLDDKLKKLESQYERLPEDRQKEIERLISFVIDFVNHDDRSKKSNISDINKYLLNKLRREKTKNKPLDIFHLRNLIIHNKPFESEYDKHLQNLVWYMLPELTYFKDATNLSNFLGNYLNVDIRDDNVIHEQIEKQMIKTKHEVVCEYKKLYDGFTNTKKKESLRELARGMFVGAQKDELRKYKGLIQQ